jgi:hypothetical protein
MAAAAEELWSGICALDRGARLTAPVPDTFPIAYLATTRVDGSPRVHPFCPILARGRLFAAIPPSSPKGGDLRRDGRCAIHASPGPDDAELCIRAVAREVGADAAVRTMVTEVVGRSAVGGMLASASEHPLFEFDLIQVDTAVWRGVGQAGTFAERSRWRAPG